VALGYDTRKVYFSGILGIELQPGALARIGGKSLVLIRALLRKRGPCFPQSHSRFTGHHVREHPGFGFMSVVYLLLGDVY